MTMSYDDQLGKLTYETFWAEETRRTGISALPWCTLTSPERAPWERAGRHLYDAGRDMLPPVSDTFECAE